MIFKTNDFQNEHKCALIKILFEKYKNYKENNYKFIIPEASYKTNNTTISRIVM